VKHPRFTITYPVFRGHSAEDQQCRSATETLTKCCAHFEIIQDFDRLNAPPKKKPKNFLSFLFLNNYIKKYQFNNYIDIAIRMCTILVYKILLNLLGYINMCTRRHFVSASAYVALAASLLKTERAEAVQRIEQSPPSANAQKKHEKFMKLAIREALKNPMYPFGAVIINKKSGKVLGRGVNTSSKNPTFHGEIVAINDYVAKNGNQGWKNTALYTTGEPCAMCMSAIAWTGIPQVIWASSIDTIRASGIGQIAISATEVATRAASIYKPEALIGGVLHEETDAIFARRRR